MEIKQVFSLIKKDLDKVERTFSKYTLSEIALATRIANYILFSGGKRVRPAIFLLCTRMCGFTKAAIYPVACAIELLHTATLLHDDVIDDAKLRRGKKAANVVWDNKASILSGDFVHAQVFKILVETRSFELLNIFTKTTVSLTNGEIFQLMKEKDTKITKEDYLYIVKNKTAVLMSAAAVTGAILGGREERERRALKTFGMNLGMAFQIIDDALDYNADEKALGKTMLADLGQGKITLPLIHILENGSRADKSVLVKIIKSDKLTYKDIKTVRKLIDKYDSISYVRNIAESYVEKAVKQLKCFRECKEKEALLTISDFVISRNY